MQLAIVLCVDLRTVSLWKYNEYTCIDDHDMKTSYLAQAQNRFVLVKPQQ